ncbi:MAG TPA: ABC transporter permease subunit, partial [Candidatus Nanopelagicales bacterium]|nr:ABC transporter permease subunit [Candidatus Nanopelagicales bacterium]
MTALAFRLELRRSRTIALWLAVVVVAYGGIVAAMYPILLENAQAFEDYMKIFPKEMLAAFGMTGSLADPGVFFGTYIGSMVWPVVATIAAIILATRPLAADVERGWADVVLSTPLTRGRLLAAAIASQALVLAGLAVATVAAVLMIGGLVGADFDAGRFAAASLVLWLFGCAIAGATSLLGALTLSRAIAGGATAGVLILMYLMNIVAQVTVDLAWLADFGAFKYLLTTELIDTGVMPWTSVVVFGVVAV